MTTADQIKQLLLRTHLVRVDLAQLAADVETAELSTPHPLMMATHYVEELDDHLLAQLTQTLRAEIRAELRNEATA